MRKRARIATIALLAVTALAAVFLLFRGATPDGRHVVREEPIAFNLRSPDAMREISPAPGEWLHLERKDRDSFVVSPLKLPAFEGDVGGVLPVVAARELDALKERFPLLELVEEGRARINKVVGYSLAFRASRSPRLYGRLVLLPQPGERSGDEPAGRGRGARDGVKLLMLANPDAGVGTARDVGTRGLLKTPFRSFRFGTTGP